MARTSSTSTGGEPRRPERRAGRVRLALRVRPEQPAGSPGRAPRQRPELPDFSRLPQRIRPEDMTTTQDLDPGPDPRGGRDTETEFLLRNAGF